MTELQIEAIARTKEWIDLANKDLGLNIPYPTVSFKLKGRCAGQARPMSNELRFNAVLLEENGNAFLKRTVPHEVAHIVARNKYGRVQSHGVEWKSVMRFFGLEPTRCHTYDTSNSSVSRKRMEREFLYKCACQTFKLTKTRHRRALKGAQYICKNCKTVLQSA